MVSQSREKDIGDLVARGIVAKVLSRLLSEPDTETQVYIEGVATPDLDGAGGPAWFRDAPASIPRWSAFGEPSQTSMPERFPRCSRRRARHPTRRSMVW